MKSGVRAVLFDLDGTLIDSAPDLAGAANALRAAHGLPPLPYEQLRPMAGSGARGMVGAALGIAPGDARYEPLRSAYLALYEQQLLDSTQIFPEMRPVLQALEQAALPWGIVTNKARRFVEPLLSALELDRRAAVVICGDTTAQAKPHPEPLLEAARRLGLPPAHCIYVGDDLRDVQAGKAAAMAALVAAWGYLGQGEPADQWGAGAILDHPAALLQWLGV